MLSHSNLSEYYKTVFALAQHHKYSIADIEALMPYEREIYFAMLIEHIQKQNEQNG